MSVRIKFRCISPINNCMLTPFLKYVSEAKVIRRHSDLQRYTFPEVTERIYISFLALALMSQIKDTQSFVKSYANQTLAKGTFDQVRMMNNDLANMLAIVSGDPDITKKLKNKNQKQKHLGKTHLKNNTRNPSWSTEETWTPRRSSWGKNAGICAQWAPSLDPRP